MATLLVFAANLLPLAGVWYWGWDAFQVLMLYWAETVILAGWTLARIAAMPPDLLGAIKVNGKERPGSNLSMTLFFAFHAGMFIGVHLIFLLVLFSGDWASRMTRPLSFVHALFIASGAWVPLVLAFFGGFIGFITATPQPTLVTRLLHRLQPEQPAFVAHGLDPKKDHIGPLVGGLYARIVVMQFGIIFGAWFSQLYGSKAPLMIVIVLKSLIELRGWSPWTVSVDDNTVTFGNDEPKQR
jgi:hypothetical protein